MTRPILVQGHGVQRNPGAFYKGRLASRWRMVKKCWTIDSVRHSVQVFFESLWERLLRQTLLAPVRMLDLSRGWQRPAERSIFMICIWKYVYTYYTQYIHRPYIYRLRIYNIHNEHSNIVYSESGPKCWEATCHSRLANPPDLQCSVPHQSSPLSPIQSITCLRLIRHIEYYCSIGILKICSRLVRADIVSMLWNYSYASCCIYHLMVLTIRPFNRPAWLYGVGFSTL